MNRTKPAPRTLLVTGGAGFIGSNFVRSALRRDAAVHIVNLDALTYAGNLESLTDVSAAHGRRGDGRYTFVHGDIRDAKVLARVLRGPQGTSGRPPVSAIVHFAAESHVDRSILGPAAFLDTNARGTLELLEAVRGELRARPRPLRFVHVSTDEVYGSLAPQDPAFREDTPLAANSPYAASKAAADLLVRAYHHTFGLDVVTTRSSNNYGPYQFPEKLVPLMVTRALADRTLPVYGDGGNVRDWIHVDDHVDAVWAVLERGRAGEVYNIGGAAEVANIDLVRQLLRVLNKPESLITYVPDRPGHDRRYAMDTGKIRRELGWAPRHTFADGMRDTVEWYLTHRDWWERVLTSAYQAAHALYLTEGSRRRAPRPRRRPTTGPAKRRRPA